MKHRADPSLQYLSTLAAIASHGSFSRAAEELGLNRAAVSKRIAAMERALGVAVLERTTRHIALTPAGRKLLEGHEEAEMLLLAAVDEARGTMSSLRGSVRVRCEDASLAVHLIAPALFDFTHASPGLQVDLCGGACLAPDIDLHIIDEPPMDRSVRVLGRISWRFYASEGYLARHGVPTTPQALAQQRFVVPASHDRPVPLVHEASGRVVVVRPDSAMTSDILGVVFELVKRGESLGLLPNYLACGATAAGALRPVLTDWRLQHLPPDTLYAVHAPARYQRAATRAILDHLASVCAVLA